MAEVDGSIRIGVFMDTEQVDRQLEALRAKLSRQTKAIDAQAAHVAKLKEQYDKVMAGDPVGVEKLEAALKRSQAEAAKLDEEYARVLESAKLDQAAHGTVSPETAARLQELRAQLDEINLKNDNLIARLMQAKIPPETTAEAQRLRDALNNATAELERMKSEAGETAARIGNLEGKSQSWPAKLMTLVKRLGGAFADLWQRGGSAMDSLLGRVRKLGRERGFRKATKGAGALATRLKSIVSGALFFNLISRGLSALTKKVGEYLKANSRFADELGRVKSNLLTAFQPVYDAAMPALTKLMEGMESATAKAAAFMATIFGTTAEQAQANAKALNEQADATKEAGEEAKKAGKFLASFDTIEKLGTAETETAAKDGQTAEAGTPKFDTDFSGVQLPKWLTDFWRVFEDGWATSGQPTMDAFRYALDSIGLLLAVLGAAFMAVWTGGNGLAVLGNLQRLLQTLLGIIGDIASSFRIAWQGGGGEEVLSALSFALTAVLGLIILIGQSFRAAWSDGIGVQICQTILSIITNIFTTVGNLAARLREAWEENRTGQKIWAAILDGVEVVLSVVDDLTSATARWVEHLDFGPLLNALLALFEAFSPVLEQLGDILTGLWEDILLPSVGWLIETGLPAVLGFLSSVLEGLSKYPGILETLTTLVGAFVAAWAVTKVVSGVAALVQTMNPLVSILGTALILFTAIAGAWDDMSGLQRAIAIIGALIAVAATAAIAVGALQSALTLGIAAAAIVAGITAVALAISSATKKAQSEGGRYSSAMNTQVGSYGNYSPRNIAGYDLTQYPHLASGAVISPNSEFLAVLGDQRNGRNLEAPEGLIRQIMREELAGLQGNGGTKVNIEFKGSLAQLGRVLQPVVTTETERRGPQIILGGDA